MSLKHFVNSGAVTFLLTAMFFIGCGDDDRNNSVGPNPPPDDDPYWETRVGQTDDGYDVLAFRERELDHFLFQVDVDTSGEEPGGVTGTLKFRNLDRERIPQVGDIIASGPTSAAEYGFLYRAVGVATAGGVTTVEVRGATLEEAIENVDFEGEVVFEFDEDGNLLRTLQKSNATNGEFRMTQSIPIPHGEITASVAYSLKVNFNVKIAGFWLQSVKMTVEQNGNLTLRGRIDGRVSHSALHPITTLPLRGYTFIIAGVPVVIFDHTTINLKVEGEAEAVVEAKYALNGHGEFGVEYRNGRFYRINNVSFDRNFYVEQRVSGKVRIGAIMNSNLMLYGVPVMDLGAGPVLELYAGANLAGNHVFDNGFRSNYSDYSSIWDITDRLLDANAVRSAINNSGNAAESNFRRPIRNEARLDFGLDYYARAVFGILGVVYRHTFAEGFIRHSTLYRTSFLPLFDAPVITAAESRRGIEVRSRIERDFLNYPVKDFGICVEIPGANDCRDGRGVRWAFGDSVRAGARREFTAVFEDLEYGDYHVRPYFTTGVATYYDRASVIEYGEDGVIDKSTDLVIPGRRGEFVDSRDGQVYGTIGIGNLAWLAENLNYQTPDSRCYGDVPANCDTYGRLYSWNEAMTACPDGWRLSDNDDWRDLETEVGGSSSAGKLKASTGWGSGSGSDEFGFTALPGGQYRLSGGFTDAGGSGNWWFADANGNGRRREIGRDNYVSNYSANGTDLHSVRCVQDDGKMYTLDAVANPSAGGSVVGGGAFNAGSVVPITAEPNPGYRFNGWTWSKSGMVDSNSTNTAMYLTSNRAITANFTQREGDHIGGTFTDSRDGQNYRTVRIGSRTWMAENLNYVTDSSWCYNNNEAQCAIYGRLYNWDAAMNACPVGWRLPDGDDWDDLIAGAAVAWDGNVSMVGRVLTDRILGGAVNGTDNYGFSARAGGRRWTNGAFALVGTNGLWWSADAIDENGDVHYRMMGNGFGVAEGKQNSHIAVSVRCVEEVINAR